jgi:hypothetical protein
MIIKEKNQKNYKPKLLNIELLRFIGLNENYEFFGFKSKLFNE